MATKQKGQGLAVMTRKVSELASDPANARKHDDRNIEAIKASLQRFGQQKPIVVDSSGVVRAGNGTLQAAKALGWETIECVVTDLKGAEATAYAIADNRSAELAEWDDDVLTATLQSLADEDPSLLVDAGFDEKELAKLVAQTAEPLEDDDVPKAPADPVTKPGDLWLLGEHRLLCGDSTNAEDVARVMDGAKAALCFTSPPYGQQRDYGVAKDKVQDWDGLMRGVFGNLPMADDGQVLVNLGLIHRDNEWQPYWDGWIEWMRGQGWRRFGWYVWDQGSGLPGDWNGRLAPSFEFVWHFNRASVKPAKTVKKREDSGPMGSNLRGKSGTNAPPSSVCNDSHKIMDSVIRVNRNSAHGTGHPATFPVPLAGSVIHAWPGDVYDPFLGSGTTLIAAEQLGRKCYGLEIDPAYCDVIVARWEKLTGKKAELEQRDSKS